MGTRTPVVRIIGAREDAFRIRSIRTSLGALGLRPSDYLQETDGRGEPPPAAFEKATQVDGSALHNADHAIIIASGHFVCSTYAIAEAAYALGERRGAERMPILLLSTDQIDTSEGLADVLEAWIARLQPESAEERDVRLRFVDTPEPTAPQTSHDGILYLLHQLVDTAQREDLKRRREQYNDLDAETRSLNDQKLFQEVLDRSLEGIDGGRLAEVVHGGHFQAFKGIVSDDGIVTTGELIPLHTHLLDLLLTGNFSEIPTGDAEVIARYAIKKHDEAFRRTRRWDVQRRLREEAGIDTNTLSGSEKFLPLYTEHGALLMWMGPLLNEKPHGWGSLRFLNGDEYEGYFYENHCTGRGVVFYADGSILSGEFRKSKPLNARRLGPNNNLWAVWQDGKCVWPLTP